MTSTGGLPVALGTDAFQLQRGSVFLSSGQLSLETIYETLTPGEHLRLFYQCRGTQLVLHGPSLLAAHVPLLTLAYSSSLVGVRGKSRP